MPVDESSKFFQLHNNMETMANIGGFWYQPELEKLSWTRQLKRIHGVAEDFQPTYAKAMAFHLPAHRLFVDQLVTESLESGGSWSTESEIERADGNRRWVAISAEVTTDEEGYITLFGSMQDITAKKRRLAQLQEQAGTLKSTLDNLLDAVITIDSDGLIKHFSQPAEKMFGYSAAEVKDKNVSVLMPEPYASEHDNYMRNYQRTGKARIIGIGREVTAQRKSGETFPADLAVTEVKQAGATHYVGIIRDITQQKENVKRLEYLANFDELTGLPNRHRFLDLVDHQLEQQMPVLVAAINIDYFNRVNTLNGHAEGDRVIKMIATRLRKLLGKTGWIARDLGDRFWIGLPTDDSSHDPIKRLEYIHQQLRTPFVTENQGYYLTASVGVAYSTEDSEENASELLGMADAATNKARNLGRDCISVYRAEIKTDVKRDLEIESQIRHALGQGQFECWLQSKVVADGSIDGAEALVRWRRADGQLVRPDEFIPVAERLKLMIPIGMEMLQQVARVIHQLVAARVPQSIAVNVSPVEFLASNFVDNVEQIFSEEGASLSLLTIEITESLLVSGEEQVQQTMQQLRLHGVTFSIDDFGTGYSNLVRLQRLPINELKIDRQFVQQAEINPKHKALLDAMLSMAKALDMKSVAEGVETAEQADYLLARGADYLQGFYYAKPEPSRSWLDQQLKAQR
ncbi:MAG: putative bifunctional diguanylate cyclase/phosphodiesterase [Pseudomonadota bacterium]